MTMQEQGGSKANKSGKQLELFIRNRLDQDYQHVRWRDFLKSIKQGNPVYTKQFPIGKGIYGSPTKSDFILYHPQKHPKCLIIESKWQSSGGSIDEKYPYLVLNIKEKFNHNTVIVIDGGGYKPGALTWLRSQVGDNLIGVFTMAEFQNWANQGNI